MVEKIFSLMDKDGSGQITIQDIIGIYDVSMNPEFIEGRKTKEEILTAFLNEFDGARGNNDGVVTKGEFFDYYTDLSMSIPSDEYFVRMLEVQSILMSWGVSGGGGMSYLLSPLYRSA